jgi:hypothetical protein
MALLHAWQRDERGGLRRRTFDHAAIPPGWYDAPDKVPPLTVPDWAEQTFSARVPEPAAALPEPGPAPAPVAERLPVRRRAGRARKR